MTTLPEITNLFARLASHLQSQKDTSHEEKEDDLNLSILKLNQSLNLDSRVTVLDTALSLMCFTSTQVFDSMINCTVKTIVSVLSSSISCTVLRFQKDEVLGIGSSFSCYDCVELVELCSDVLRKLEGHGMLSHLLLRAVVRVAVLASAYQYLFPSTLILDVRSTDGRSTTVSKLLCHLPREFSLNNHEIPLRLLFWYLDPLSLKHEVSKFLQETMERPFLCLKKEFYGRMEWRSIITCLVLSPTMFIETRALLHNWFLLTGLPSVLELLNELVSLVLDIISRPTWWGISVEWGSKLPFSNAYFPYKHHLLRIFAGPLLSESFLTLVHATSKPVSCGRKRFDPTIKSATTKVATIDHKSIWALAINFPDWFYFACIILFSEKSFQDNFQSKCTLGASINEKGHDLEPPTAAAASAAARYIAWILSPICKSDEDLLVDCLTKISESWTLKQFGSGAHDKETAGYRKKLKKPKICDDKEYDCQKIGLWLKEFQNMCVKYCDKSGSSSGPSVQQNMLFRRIPLGILIGCSNHINEDGCELLLHYAATGRIRQLREIKCSGGEHAKWNSEGLEDTITWTDGSNRKEAVAGACLVFTLTDIVESMSASMFETEEDGLDYIFKVKVRTGKYLIKCIKKLMHLKINKHGVLMDFCSRLVQWRHQGPEVLQFQKDLDEVINDLSEVMRDSMLLS